MFQIIKDLIASCPPYPDFTGLKFALSFHKPSVIIYFAALFIISMHA